MVSVFQKGVSLCYAMLGLVLTVYSAPVTDTTTVLSDLISKTATHIPSSLDSSIPPSTNAQGLTSQTSSAWGYSSAAAFTDTSARVDSASPFDMASTSMMPHSSPSEGATSFTDQSATLGLSVTDMTEGFRVTRDTDGLPEVSEGLIQTRKLVSEALDRIKQTETNYCEALFDEVSKCERYTQGCLQVLTLPTPVPPSENAETVTKEEVMREVWKTLRVPDTLESVVKVGVNSMLKLDCKGTDMNPCTLQCDANRLDDQQYYCHLQSSVIPATLNLALKLVTHFKVSEPGNYGPIQVSEDSNRTDLMFYNLCVNKHSRLQLESLSRMLNLYRD